MTPQNKQEDSASVLDVGIVTKEAWWNQRLINILYILTEL